jgi:hypothetical protein
MVAKVICPDGSSYFVKKGEDIHNFREFDHLPKRDREFLACETIEGCYGGFALLSDFQDNIFVTRESKLPPPQLPGVGAKWESKNDVPILVLPEGTRIEPRTNHQMEDELRARQHPSLREK